MAVLEGFESVDEGRPTTLFYWDSYPALQKVAAITQGSFAARVATTGEVAGSSPGLYIYSQDTVLDTILGAALTLDVVVNSIESDARVTLTVYDSTFTPIGSDQTALGTTGSDTLSVNTSGYTPVGDPIYIEIIATLPTGGDVSFDVDNMKSDTTLIEGFETWGDVLPDTLGWVRTDGRFNSSQVTSHVTEGTYAWRAEGTMSSFSTRGISLSGISQSSFGGTLTMDVYVNTIQATSLVRMALFYEKYLTFVDTMIDATVAGATGADTLTIDTSGIAVTFNKWVIDCQVQASGRRAGITTGFLDLTGYQGVGFGIIDYDNGAADAWSYGVGADDGSISEENVSEYLSEPSVIDFVSAGIDETNVKLRIFVEGDATNSTTSILFTAIEIRAYPDINDDTVYDVIETFAGTFGGGGDLGWSSFTSGGGVFNGVTNGTFTPTLNLQLYVSSEASDGAFSVDFDNIDNGLSSGGAVFSQSVIIT